MLRGPRKAGNFFSPIRAASLQYHEKWVEFPGVTSAGADFKKLAEAALALSLIVVQMVQKFPAVQEMSGDLDRDDHESEIKKRRAERARKMFKDRYRSGIYLVLGALAVPGCVLVLGGARRPT